MSESYIEEIYIDKSRNITDLKIPMSEKGQKHLILTGKNGSGKTSLLEDINQFLRGVEDYSYKGFSTRKERIKNHKKEIRKLESQDQVRSDRIKKLNDQIGNDRNVLNRYGSVELFFSNTEELDEKINNGEFIITYFKATRNANLREPSGIEKIDLKKRYRIKDKANRDFIQYLVNLKADKSFARDDGDFDDVKKIENWFEKFENNLRELFGTDDLKLEFDRNSYNFKIHEKEKEPFSFNTLADGYSAIISIVSELLMRMEAHNKKSYDLEGIVLIDEIETHLHVKLQKKVLPFLKNFFPQIQFIVTTHSPFVLSSISDSVICDLEKEFVTEDLTGYSYDAIIESYFDSDKYSEIIKKKINKYEELKRKDGLNANKRDELRRLEKYFESIPKYLSNELMVKLQQIKLDNLDSKFEQE